MTAGYTYRVGDRVCWYPNTSQGIMHGTVTNLVAISDRSDCNPNMLLPVVTWDVHFVVNKVWVHPVLLVKLS